MNVLTGPLRELAEFEQGRSLFLKEQAAVGFSGLYDSQKLHMIAGLSEDFPMKVILTFSDKRAREI